MCEFWNHKRLERTLKISTRFACVDQTDNSVCFFEEAINIVQRDLLDNRRRVVLLKQFIKLRCNIHSC